MLGSRRLPPQIRGRLVASWMVHPSSAHGRYVAPTPAFHPSSVRQFSSMLHRDRSCRLSTAAVAAISVYGNKLLAIERPDGGVRWVSGTSRRAGKVNTAHGARREAPAIPSFIEIRYSTAAIRRARPLLQLLLLLSKKNTAVLCLRRQQRLA